MKRTMTDTDVVYEDYLSKWTEVKDVHYWDSIGTLSKLLGSIEMPEKVNSRIQQEIVNIIKFARFEAFKDGLSVRA